MKKKSLLLYILIPVFTFAIGWFIGSNYQAPDSANTAGTILNSSTQSKLSNIPSIGSMATAQTVISHDTPGVIIYDDFPDEEFYAIKSASGILPAGTRVQLVAIKKGMHLVMGSD